MEGEIEEDVEGLRRVAVGVEVEGGSRTEKEEIVRCSPESTPMFG